MEKRYFNPKSSFIGLSAGFFLNQTKEVGGAKLFKNNYYSSSQFQFSFEKGFSNYYYWKTGVNYQSYSLAQQVRTYSNKGISSNIKTIGINLGAGKRMILKN